MVLASVVFFYLRDLKNSCCLDYSFYRLYFLNNSPHLDLLNSLLSDQLKIAFACVGWCKVNPAFIDYWCASLILFFIFMIFLKAQLVFLQGFLTSLFSSCSLQVTSLYIIIIHNLYENKVLRIQIIWLGESRCCIVYCNYLYYTLFLVLLN